MKITHDPVDNVCMTEEVQELKRQRIQLALEIAAIDQEIAECREALKEHRRQMKRDRKRGEQ